MYRVARRFRLPICTESINRSRRSYYRAMIIRRPMVSGRTACAEAVNDGAIRGLPNPGSGRPPKELTSEPSEAVMVEGESISAAPRAPAPRRHWSAVRLRRSERSAKSC